MTEKLEMAVQAASSGDYASARQLLRDLLQDDPDNELAWLWLARVAEDDRDRRAHLAQVLRINPDNQDARQGLRSISADVHPEAQDTAPLAPEPEPWSSAMRDLPDESWQEPQRPRWFLPVALGIAAAVIICALVVGLVVVPRLLREGEATAPAVAGDATATAALVEPQFTTIARTAEAGAGPTSAGAGAAVSSGLPDLTVQQVQVDLETGGACSYPSTELGTRVVIANKGPADAGPFVVEVNGAQQMVPAGLPAGQTVSVWLIGYAQGAETEVVVDATSRVQEQDEDNNSSRQMLPIPTLPPTCTPPPEGTPVPPAGATTVGNAEALAPIRITSRSLYSDEPSSFMQVEVDAQGNAWVAVDLPGQLEEWYLFDDVVYAGEGGAEGVEPYGAVESPQVTAGFTSLQDLYGPAGGSQFSQAFPVHGILWEGLGPERAEKVGSETVHGLSTDRYRLIVSAEEVRTLLPDAGDSSEKLADAVATLDDNQIIDCWVEPESGSYVKAEWSVSYADGTKAQYTLDVTPVEVGPFQLPRAVGLPNPASTYCEEQGYRLETRSEADGEAGYCVFPDGTECEEWAFYRGECGPMEMSEPGKAFDSYWAAINSGQFEAAWSLLSADLQRKGHSSRYENYLDYYKKMRLCSITVKNVEVGEATDDEATITARLVYRTGKQCKRKTQDYRFRLVYNGERDAWLIDDMSLR